ncbi:MAG: VOC family protein [Bacteroidota bacterium]|nr:VOC family protein [Bacteroidota bacterium]
MQEKERDPLWVDITVDDAETLRDFYAAVVGWESVPVAMGGYEDYAMSIDGDAQAGICHARGVNAKLPPVWLPYFRVESIEASIQHCLDRGGELISPAKTFGPGQSYAVIRDPSGAACAIWSAVDSQ